MPGRFVYPARPTRKVQISAEVTASSVSGHLTAPCRDFGKSADVDRFDGIGSHIWSII